MAATIPLTKRCKELFGLTREDLGIIASSRATMYYNGNHYPVNIDNFRGLAQNGVAIIVIEKEGIADLLYQFADKYGVALVHTQGRFTEDGKELIEAVKEYGSFIGILVDYDAVGNEIAKATRTETPIIGINKETIAWLQQNDYEITISDVEEEYTPNIRTRDPYLQSYRIELDSVAQKVGAEALWKYVMYRVKELAAPDGLDYRNVISKPAVEVLYQADISESLSYLNRYANHVIKPDWDKIDEELSNVPELINIEDKKSEIDEILSPKLTEDPDMQLVAKTLKELVEKLPKVEDADDDDFDPFRDNDEDQNEKTAEEKACEESGLSVSKFRKMKRQELLEKIKDKLRSGKMSIDQGYKIIKKMETGKMSVDEAYEITERYDEEAEE